MTHKRVWSRPPISMDFQVLMFTSSGLLVRFLKVFEKSGYQSVKWVRYMTKAGSYQIRVSIFKYIYIRVFITHIFFSLPLVLRNKKKKIPLFNWVTGVALHI